MATATVSAAAANGIPLGNNGTAGLDDDQTPYLTLAAAMTATSAGDTIRLNGTVAAPQTFSGGSSFVLQAGSNRTFDSVAGDKSAAIITSTNANYAVELRGAAGCVFNKVTIDSTLGTSGSCIRVTNNAAINTVFNGTGFIAVDNYALFMTVGFVLAGDWSITTGSGEVDTGLINCPLAVAGSVVISGGSINGTVNIGQAVLFDATVAACNFSMNGTTVNLTHAGSAANASVGIQCRSAAKAEIHNNTITLIGCDAPRGIQLNDDASLSCDSARISSNSVNFIPAGTIDSGMCIQVGEDAAGLGGGIDDVKVFKNVVSNGDHGIFAGGGVSNYHAWGNTVKNCVLSLVTKRSVSTVKMTGNLVTSPKNGGACLYHKGSNAAVIANNTVIVSDDRTDPIMLSGSDGGTHSVNGTFINNDIQCPTASFVKLAQIDASNTGVFSNNNYNAPLKGTDFDFQGASNNISDWLARETAPLIGIASKDLGGAGVVVANAIDFTGHAYLDSPSVGYKELNISSGGSGGGSNQIISNSIIG